MKTRFIRTIAWIVATIMVGCSAVLNAQTETIRFDRLSINDGLSNSYVTWILQDKKGFMWFGTQDGLDKYDGYEFTVYKHDPSNPNSLSDNYVRSMCEDKEGILWIGTENGGLNKFDPSTETFTHFKHEPDNRNSLSQNSVRVIFVDESGIIWIGTNGKGLDRFNSKNNTFTHYKHNPNDSNSLSNNSIQAIYKDSAGNLWVGTIDGLNRLVLSQSPEQSEGENEGSNQKSGKWERYYHDPKNPNSLNHSGILSICEDREGTLWIGTFAGLNKMEAETSIRYKKIILGPDAEGYGVQSICEDQFGKLWIGSYLGVDKFDPDISGKESFTRYRYDSGDPKSLSGTPVTTIFKDRSGVLWFGTGGSGISKLNPSTKNFAHYRHIPGNPNSLSHPSVRGIYEDENGILWVGGYRGLNRIERKNNRFTHFNTTNANGHQLSTDLIYTIIGDPDNDHILWLGSEGGGLYRFDKNSGKAKHYSYRPDVSNKDVENSLSSNFVFDLYLDAEGILWIATDGGLNRMNKATNEITVYIHEPDNPLSLSSDKTRVIYADRKGKLWIGTEASGLNRFDRQTEQFTRFLHDPDDPFSLSNNRIKSIYEDPTNILWIGTNGGGLNRFDRKTETFKHYTEKDGLPSDVVYGILSAGSFGKDDDGKLWLSTNGGLSRFDPETETFRNYDVNDGLQSNEFNTASYFKSKSGEMFFGGINGLNAFFPSEIRDNPYVPPIVITDFQIANKSVPIGETGEERQILRRHISDSDEITLTYKDYLFSFEFAALSYAAPGKNKYAYKMEGFDSDWLYTDAKKRFATYTSLPAGKYIFKVKGTNNDGIWNEAGTSIRLIITPPLWKTWWAYVIYIIIIGSAVAGIIRFEIKQVRLKNQLQLEHMEAVKLQELDQMKSHFFANISHEFRTPLTLIKGPMEDIRLKRYGPISRPVRKQLDMSLKNVDRLQRLIDELLDLSRLEAGKLTLQASYGDLSAFIRRIVDSFSIASRKRSIKLNLNADTQVIELYFDHNKLKKVMNNLLINAIKFTPDGGTITVSVQDLAQNYEERGTGSFVMIKVADSGIGIPPEALPRIFDRFYQVDSSATRSYEGTGIGLALVKEFVELHGGEISVESAVGTGTTFTLTLPKGTAHLSEEELISKDETAELEARQELVYGEELEGEETIETDEVTLPKDAGTVLIVEDNADMRSYLREHLSPPYHVEEAGDGVEGWQKAREVLPDLIISDIMMPRMDGIELCREIRKDDILRNVPVILLTAKAGEEDRLKGLETKADDYITKPFSQEELKLRIHNLIERRKKLWEEFNRKVVAWRSEELQLDSVDKAFLEQVRNVVEAHISDNDFNVEVLARKVFFSRRQLYRRLNDLTGLTPAHFIRQIRLMRAKQLLDEQALSTVSEVARAVGFSKVEYFSLLFRNTFGQTPGDLIRK